MILMFLCYICIWNYECVWYWYIHVVCMQSYMEEATVWCRIGGRRYFLFASIYGGWDRLMLERGKTIFLFIKNTEGKDRLMSEDGGDDVYIFTHWAWLWIIASFKVLNIGYQDRIGWGFFISNIGYGERYRRYAHISGFHIRHYIYIIKY